MTEWRHARGAASRQGVSPRPEGALALVALFLLATPMPSFSKPLSSPGAEDLIAEWVLDETTDRDPQGQAVIRDRGGWFEGRVVGRATWTKTPFGKALVFDGSNYVKVAYNANLHHEADQLSIEVLLKPEPDEAANMPILIRGMHHGGYALRAANGRYQAILGPWKSLSGGYVEPEPSLVIATYKDALASLYVNGDLASKGSIATTLKPSAEKRPLVIGGFESWSSAKGYQPEPGFKGWIRLVRIYRVALTEEQVRAEHGRLFGRDGTDPAP